MQIYGHKLNMRKIHAFYYPLKYELYNGKIFLNFKASFIAENLAESAVQIPSSEASFSS